MSPTVELMFRSVEVAVLLLTAGIVWWYTRETTLLRRAAQEQNGLLSQQVSLARQAHEAAALRHEAELERMSVQVGPVIGGWGGRWNQIDPHDATMRFTNKGGLMKNLAVESQGDFSCSIRPTGLVAQGEQAEISFKEVPLNEPSPFLIHYDNLFGKRGSVALEYQNGNVCEQAR